MGPFETSKICGIDRAAQTCSPGSSSDPCVAGEPQRTFCSECFALSTTEHYYSMETCTCIEPPK